MNLSCLTDSVYVSTARNGMEVGSPRSGLLSEIDSADYFLSNLDWMLRVANLCENLLRSEFNESSNTQTEAFENVILLSSFGDLTEDDSHVYHSSEGEEVYMQEIFRELIDSTDDDPPKKNPVPTSVINKIPVIKLNRGQKRGREKCPICYEKFRWKEKVMLLSCNHFYHPRCIRRWFKEQNFCPVCRRQM